MTTEDAANSNLEKKITPSNEASKTAVDMPPLKLERQVGPFTAAAFVVGSMIGTGIFISPSGILENAGSAPVSLLIWLACGCYSLVGALCYAELGSVIPLSGGEYSYLLHTFRPTLGPQWGALPAFFFLWTMAALLIPASSAILCLTFADYFLRLFLCEPPTLYLLKVWAIFATVSLTVINCLSVRITALSQNALSIIKLAILAIIVGGGIIYLAHGHNEGFSLDFNGKTVTLAGIAQAFYYGTWAFGGWNSLNVITEELIDPDKNLSRALIAGIGTVTLAYLLTNAAYLIALSPQDMINSNMVALTFAKRALTPSLSLLMPLLVALSAYGGELCSAFSSGRIYFAAAREGHLMEILSYVSLDFRTPTPALLLKGILATVMILIGDIGALISLLGFTQGLVTLCMMIALFTLRRTRKDTPRAVKVPLLFPVMLCLFSIYTVIAPLIAKPHYLYALLLILAGLIFYLPFIYFGLTCSYAAKVTEYLKDILRVGPTEYPLADVYK